MKVHLSWPKVPYVFSSFSTPNAMEGINTAKYRNNVVAIVFWIVFGPKMPGNEDEGSMYTCSNKIYQYSLQWSKLQCTEHIASVNKLSICFWRILFCMRILTITYHTEFLWTLTPITSYHTHVELYKSVTDIFSQMLAGICFEPYQILCFNAKKCDVKMEFPSPNLIQR